MPQLIVSSHEYGELFKKLLMRRLEEAGESFSEKGGALLVPNSAAAAGAISETIVGDLKLPELARLVRLLPVSLREMRAILPRAAALTDDEKLLGYALEAAKEYVRSEKKLIAEGFLRFRLPLVMEAWALAVDRAGEELVIGTEYGALLGMLGETARPEKNADELTLILHGDGSFVISDENGCRIESASTHGPALLLLLAGLGPERLRVFDLSGGSSQSVLIGIRSIFGARACFFVPRE